MRSCIIGLCLILSSIGWSLDYYRNFSSVDFFEMMSIYQGYVHHQHINSLYTIGLPLTALGISQSSDDVTITGVSYIGNALLSQLKIFEDPYTKKFDEYRGRIHQTSTKEEMDRIAMDAINNLIEQERNDLLISGGMMACNGVLLMLNPMGQGRGIGLIMTVYGIYTMLNEKGPLEQMVRDYDINRPMSLPDDMKNMMFEQFNRQNEQPKNNLKDEEIIE